MRALVDMSDDQVEALDALAERQRRSRASLIRAAIDDYLAKHGSTDLEASFGLWKDEAIDGLAFQDDMRREW
jgi:predicted transcriptional regulator